MTNIEAIAQAMTGSEETPLFSLACRYWILAKRNGCDGCPLWNLCDSEDSFRYDQKEEWLKKEVEE